MTPFLEKVAQEILVIHGHELRKACIVLPNRRAGLFLKKHLAHLSGRTIWAPAIFSIEDFVMEYCGLTPADPVTLLFELYAVHREVAGEQHKEFEEFADIGPLVLKDFNETDLYLADPVRLFNFLSEAKAIATWNPDGRPLTKFQQDYLAFYRSLLLYYNALKDRLYRKNLAFQGMAYRHMAEKIDVIGPRLPYEKIYFTGLNALTYAEEVIIDRLLLQGRAELFWDADAYYLGRNLKEAGKFLEGYFNKWPSSRNKWIENSFIDQPKEITVTGIAGLTGQAKYAGKIISDWLGSYVEKEKTAIVLANERLLVPVLYSLPEAVNEVNITMGYPLRATSLYQFFRSWFRMHLNSDKIRKSGEGGQDRFFVRDTVRLLLHHQVSQWDLPLVEGTGTIQDVVASLRKSNRVLIGGDELVRLAEGSAPERRELIRVLFSPWTDAMESCSCLMSFMNMLRDNMAGKLSGEGSRPHLELEYIFRLYQVVNNLRRILSGQGDANSVRDLHKVLFQTLDQARIPFYGEPLKGIQIMGLLETRTVDFDQVIILGANEGTLPSGKGMQSFIPFDIRKEFNLPTHQEKDAVFAYHFYRLMQRARKVHLVYDTEPDELGGGEQSRFITQLSYELTRFNPQVRLDKQIVSVAPSERPIQVPISIEKTRDILDILSAKADSGLSPSVLSRYINCPLQFYFNFVADLSTEEDLEETIEAKTLGKVVHHALHQLYQPLVGRSAGPEEVRELISQVAPALEEAFAIEYPGGELQLGKNLLVNRAAAELLRKLIAKESNDLKQARKVPAPLRILSLEQKLSAVIEIHPAGKKMTVRIKGTPDRIDVLDGTTRIIDYKTGTVENSGVNVKAWEDLFLDPKLSMAFQLLVYSFLYDKVRPVRSTAGVVPGILSLRNLGKGLLKVEVPEGNFGEEGLPPVFNEGLKHLLEEIFDPSVAFDQAVDETRCERCDFRAICNRF